MKILIFDSSSLITLTMNGIEHILTDLKKEFKGKFIIPKTVKYEVVDRPINIKKFELGALKLQDLMTKRIIELPSSLKINEAELNKIASQIQKSSNKTFSSENKFMDIIQAGEAECLALSLLSKEKNIDNLVVVDERTTRMLVEKPENLQKVFENKLHTKIRFHRENLPNLLDIHIIRSAELVYMAYKKNLIKFGDGKLLDALLYGVKFKGCSISQQEIEELKRL